MAQSHIGSPLLSKTNFQFNFLILPCPVADSLTESICPPHAHRAADGFKTNLNRKEARSQDQSRQGEQSWTVANPLKFKETLSSYFYIFDKTKKDSNLLLEAVSSDCHRSQMQEDNQMDCMEGSLR